MPAILALRDELRNRVPLNRHLNPSSYRKWYLVVAALLFFHTGRLTIQAAEYIAAPNGSRSGTGTIASPWDLATALSRSDAIKPGDILYLRGGTYRGGYACVLKGTSKHPITIRQYPDERAIIDCQSSDRNPLFQVGGEWLVFWGLEITCSHPKRLTDTPGSWPNDIRRGGITCRGSHIKFINLTLHDLGDGIDWWSEGEAGEVYGCVIFANGWQGPDRVHGHGIYAQNKLGTKRIADNIIFNQFGYGIHCYGSDQSSLSGFEIDGNILFANGSLGASPPECANILVGGSSPVSRTTVTRNVSLHQGTCARFGYPWGPENSDIAIAENYFVGQVSVDRFEYLFFNRNRVHGHHLIEYTPSLKKPLHEESWNDNLYWITDGDVAPFTTWRNSTSSQLTYRNWRMTEAADSRSQFTKNAPDDVRVFVRPNKYEAGRANVAILNWTRLKSVAVDLSSTLRVGQKFRIVNVQSLDSPPIVEGLFDGKPILIPIDASDKYRPIGWPKSLPSLEPLFAAFLVLP
jgi:Right handed beta helix region